MSDKDIKLTSSPEDKAEWPTEPLYTPLWDEEKIRQEFEGLIKFRGHEAIPVAEQSEVMSLILRIVGEYDRALYKAQFELWTARGVEAVSLNASA